FAGVYPILKEMEDRGQVRRGYFVTGLGAAQFALPGAVDRLRDERQDTLPDEPPPPVTLTAVDPAQPYGAAIPWPENGGRPARATGSYVVLRNGVPLVYCHRGGRSITVFDGGLVDHAWVAELIALVADKRLRMLEIQKVNGEPIAEHPEVQEALLAGGFRSGYRGPTYRR
ncbi:MAG: Lhr family helicase, partial [Acidimicrobiales bacterium]